jgi:hypothetical protein
MRATKSRPISLLAAAVAASAVSALLIGAPTAVADPPTIDCQEGQIVIDGQCNVGPVDPNRVVVPPVDHPYGSGPVMGDPGMGGAGHGR